MRSAAWLLSASSYSCFSVAWQMRMVLKMSLKVISVACSPEKGSRSTCFRHNICVHYNTILIMLWASQATIRKPTMPAVCTCKWLCILAGMTCRLPLHILPGLVLESGHNPSLQPRAHPEACPKQWRLAGLHSMRTNQYNQARHIGNAPVSQAKSHA